MSSERSNVVLSEPTGYLISLNKLSILKKSVKSIKHRFKLYMIFNLNIAVYLNLILTVNLRNHIIVYFQILRTLIVMHLKY